LTSVRQTCTMFYVENLFSFLPRHFLQNSHFGFRQLPQLRKATMVDSEGPTTHSAAASHYKVSRHHCGQVGCLFARDCALFPSVCFVLFRHCHCLRSSSFDQPFHSFFFLSLRFLLIVGCRLVPPSLEFLGAGFILRASPFLGVGLGGAPIP
jgi:hypothetical protein